MKSSYIKENGKMKIRTVIIALFSAIILLGCTNNQQDENANTDETIYEQTSDTSESNRNPTNEEIANHLADIAKSIPDVENAFAVVAGPYAVVGIDVDKSIERERVGTIKFSVSEALRDDKYGKTAVVVADADGTERIRRMAEKIRNGEPIQGIVDELAEIVARYMPIFPVEEQHNDQPDKQRDKMEEIENEPPEAPFDE